MIFQILDLKSEDGIGVWFHYSGLPNWLRLLPGHRHMVHLHRRDSLLSEGKQAHRLGGWDGADSWFSLFSSGLSE